MIYNYDKWVKKHNECVKSINRICELDSKYDSNKCSSASCVICHAMQDINTYFKNECRSIAELCFLIRNIDVIITCILDLNNILLGIGLRKQDHALNICFQQPNIVHNFRTLRSLILAHPVDTNFINEVGKQEIVYLEDILPKSRATFLLKLEEFDYVMKFCSPNSKIPHYKELKINRDIIPVIEEIINGISLLTVNVDKLIKKYQKKLSSTPLNICNNTIQDYIITLDKELQKRYPNNVEDIEYENGIKEHHSIVYDCLVYVNVSFSKNIQKEYEKFLEYIKDELKRIELDIQNMTYDIYEDSYFTLCYNQDFASEENYAKEKMAYLKRSDESSFVQDEIPNSIESNSLWGVEQFKKLIPYIEQYFPVDTSVSDKGLYCQYVAAEYLSNISKGER